MICLLGMTLLVSEWQRSGLCLQTGCANAVSTGLCCQMRSQVCRFLSRFAVNDCVYLNLSTGTRTRSGICRLHGAQMPIKGHATCILQTGMSCQKTTYGFTRPSRENSLSFPGLPAAASRMPAKCVSPGAATASRADGACDRRTEQPQSGLPASWLDWRNL